MENSLTKDIFLSIITVNKNNGDGLKKTIESVINQTGKNFEYIIIDGASTDNSVNVIESYKDKIDYYTSEEDAGIYNAMNKGIKKANGKFCIFLNSGDYFSNNNILELLESNIEEGIELYYGNIKYENSGREYTFSYPLNILQFIEGSIAHGASFIKKDLFNTLGLYNEKNKIVSDWEFFINALLIHRIKHKHIPFVTTIYQDGGISTNKEFTKQKTKEREVVLASLLPQYIDLIKEYHKLKAFKNSWTKSFFYKLHNFLSPSRGKQ